jgi:glyoxylase-like metal-dependent hydrolase (beta-lactamase superfamily II)
MVQPEIISVTQNIKLLHLRPPIPGYNEFIGPYLLSGKENAVIDIGPSTALPSFLSALAKTSINYADIHYMIFTHIHIDHAGGAGTAAKALPNAKVVAHSRAHEHLINPGLLWEASLKVLGDYAVKSGPIEPVPEEKIIDAVDGMRLDLGRGLALEIYLTPGHAVHHLCVFYPAAGLLFSGEAAGVCINGVIRLATPPPFKLEIMLASIDKLIELKPKKLCYSHFGCYDNGLERLKLYRKKVLQWFDIVSSEAESGNDLQNILRVLREKDRDLDYLNNLKGDVYDREVSLIFNSIRGLSGPRLKKGN